MTLIKIRTHLKHLKTMKILYQDNDIQTLRNEFDLIIGLVEDIIEYLTEKENADSKQAEIK